MQQAKEQVEGVGGASVAYEAETVIASVTGITTGVGRGTVDLEAVANLTTNAGTTKTTLRIRRTGVAGTEVAKVVVKPGASGEVSIPMQAIDVPPGELAGGTYVLTAQETAAVSSTSVSSRISATF